MMEFTLVPGLVINYPVSFFLVFILSILWFAFFCFNTEFYILRLHHSQKQAHIA